MVKILINTLAHFNFMQKRMDIQTLKFQLSYLKDEILLKNTGKILSSIQHIILKRRKHDSPFVMILQYGNVTPQHSYQS
jgi:hypothetical protein